MGFFVDYFVGISMPTGLEDQVVIAWLRVTCLDVNVRALAC